MVQNLWRKAQKTLKTKYGLVSVSNTFSKNGESQRGKNVLEKHMWLGRQHPCELLQDFVLSKGKKFDDLGQVQENTALRVSAGSQGHPKKIMKGISDPQELPCPDIFPGLLDNDKLPSFEVEPKNRRRSCMVLYL